MEYKKKLIEVALPLEAINKAAAYEKMPGIGPHPRGIHLWWARRPLAAARAVIWSSLVDDPSSLPDEFPTEEEQAKERERLFGILERLVQWENTNNQEVLDEAKAEIMKSTNGNPPALLDPFAGGGAIPLEAQRLGLEAHASDLNPVAVMINKAMIEIPSKFADQPPVNPDAKLLLQEEWPGYTGLTDDVKYYGEWMKNEAVKRIGHLYPRAKDKHGKEHTVIAWIWARTVKCPNPACGCEMPLVNNFTLSRKKNKNIYVEPIIEGTDISFQIREGNPKVKGTIISRKGAKCICCDTTIDFAYIRNEGAANRIGRVLIAIVADGDKGKIYLPADSKQMEIADVEAPKNIPCSEIPYKALGINIKAYGFNNHVDLFTNRQLSAITVLNDLVLEAQEEILKDGATVEYANSISVYLSFAVDRCADFSNAVTRWVPSNEKVMNLFGRQTIAMTWDYPEANVLENVVGGFIPAINYISQCILKLVERGKIGNAIQADAQTRDMVGPVMISTDPPYYDNIGYADLSDFFYIWLRRSLRGIYPQLFNTMLVPKTEELIANPFRFDEGMSSAREYFEDGMLQTFKQIAKYATIHIPVTVYYAFKQSDYDDKDNVASTGWETMLTAIIQAGFSIVGTWPMRTEQTTRNRSIGSNALASSIVLVCRKRDVNSPICTRRDFINLLKREMKLSLRMLQESNIAPVDLAQSSIGPGIGVYSRFSKVLEADGSIMSVRSALQIINQELDLFFSEQDGELDSDSRFCVDLYTQYAFNDVKFGEADVLARAKNTSVEKLAGHGILYAEKGIVRLLPREEITKEIGREKTIWLLTQQLTYALEKDGVLGAAKIVADIYTSEPEHAKALAYRLFQLAERKGWAQEALAYNSLVIAWPEIHSKAAELNALSSNAEQITIFEIEKKD